MGIDRDRRWEETEEMQEAVLQRHMGHDCCGTPGGSRLPQLLGGS